MSLGENLYLMSARSSSSENVTMYPPSSTYSNSPSVNSNFSSQIKYTTEWFTESSYSILNILICVYELSFIGIYNVVFALEFSIVENPYVLQA